MPSRMPFDLYKNADVIPSTFPPKICPIRNNISTGKKKTKIASIGLLTNFLTLYAKNPNYEHPHGKQRYFKINAIYRETLKPSVPHAVS